MMNQGHTNKTPSRGRGYKGIGGWLAFFIVSLTIFSPILTLSKIVREYDDFRFSLPTILDGVFSISLMCFGTYAGFRLLKIKPNAVRTAKRFLIAMFVYLALVALLSIVGGLLVQPHERVLEALGTVVPSLSLITIWYSYLQNSKRVAATYATSVMQTREIKPEATDENEAAV